VNIFGAIIVDANPESWFSAPKKGRPNVYGPTSVDIPGYVYYEDVYLDRARLKVAVCEATLRKRLKQRKGVWFCDKCLFNAQPSKKRLGRCGPLPVCPAHQPSVTGRS